MSLPQVAVTLALLALASGPAFAAPRAADPGDIRVKMPEISASDCDAQFKRFDADQNGKLTYAEFASGRYGRLRFVHAETPEAVARHMQRYESIARQADVNKNGWLTLVEHRAACQSGP